MAVGTFKITGQTAAGGITANVVDNAAIAASLAGAGAITSGVILGPAVIRASLAGAGTLTADITFQIVLSNDAASVSGYDITVTATSSGSLASGVYGVEYGRTTYDLSKNIVGQATNQSITIGFTDGITSGVWNVRDYYNLDPADPYTTRVYSGATFQVVAGAIEATLAGAGSLSAAVLQQQIITQQTLAGAGTISIGASLCEAIEAAIAGSGTITADVTIPAGGTVQVSATLDGVGTLTADLTGGSAPVVTVAGTGSGAGRAFRYYRVPEKLPEIKRELERVARKVKKTTLEISLRRSNQDLAKLLEMLNDLQERYARLRYAYEAATKAMLAKAEAEEESEFMDFISRL